MCLLNFRALRIKHNFRCLLVYALHVASIALALGFNISGTPFANVAVNPFASALAGLVFSKGLNYTNEVPTQLLSQIEGVVTEAAKQIPASDPTPSPAAPT